MKCKKAIDLFFESEEGGPVSGELKALLEQNPDCAKKISSLRMHLDGLKHDAPFIPQPGLSAAIMKKVYERPAYGTGVSSLHWILSGMVIAASLALLSFSETFLLMKSFFGIHFELPLALVLGLVTSIYAWTFAWSHLADFRRIIDREY